MITNPKVGMRVVANGTRGLAFIKQVGSIRTIYDADHSVEVVFDRPIYGWHSWIYTLENLTYEVLSPEQEDQKKRLEHAMKYL